MPESTKKSLSPGRANSLTEARDKKEQNNELYESPFLKACRREAVPYTPIWLMRQAGRYMKEFRDIRSKVSFLELCKSPTLACEVTVHAQETLGADAAIIFADILLILDSLKVGLEFVKGEGPRIERPLRSQQDFDNLPPVEVHSELSYVFEAIKLTRQSLRNNIPLIGFAAAPFTLASYLIEAGASRNYENTKLMMYARPELWHKLLNKLTDISIDYLNAQVEAGAQALQLFDSWVGVLSESDYRKFVLPYSKRLISKISAGTPVIHFGTGNASLLSLMKEAGSSVLGLDWRVDLADTWNKLGDNLAVQGNLDPCVLLADKEEIKARAHEILKSVAGKPGHIFNLGHGILPSTDPDKVRYLIECVQTFRG